MPHFPANSPTAATARVIIVGHADPRHRRQRLRRLAARAAAVLATGTPCARSAASPSASQRRARGRTARRRAAGGSSSLRGDALTARASTRALDGVEVAYYLIHSMERVRRGRGAVRERERIAAENFAARGAPGGRVGGSSISAASSRTGASRRDAADVRAPRSRHLASREQVERILLDAVPDSVALRASIVIGARSRSFRLLVRLVERMPVLALPAWQRFRTQPIDERDVIEMLAACAERARRRALARGRRPGRAHLRRDARADRRADARAAARRWGCG